MAIRMGALFRDAWTTSNRNGNTLTLNGSSNLVNVNDASSLDLTAEMTIEAWVYPTSLSGWRTDILKEMSGGFTYARYAYDNAPRLI